MIMMLVWMVLARLMLFVGMMVSVPVETTLAVRVMVAGTEIRSLLAFDRQEAQDSSRQKEEGSRAHGGELCLLSRCVGLDRTEIVSGCCEFDQR